MAALFDNAAAYAQAFARAPIGMALIGLDSRFCDVNEAFCAIAGRTREELIGQPFGLVTHPDDVGGDVALAIEAVRGARNVFRREKRWVRPDGSVRWVEVNASLLSDDAGRPVHFLSHVQDITERRRTEQLKDEFLATISHELRTPLTSIQGYVDLLAEEDELSPSARRHAFAVIQRNAARLRRLVEDVQFIAQARADTLTLDHADVQLDRVVVECTEWAATRAAGLEIDLSVDADDVTISNGDSARLGQAIDHLVANALFYTPPGGRVEVRLTREGDDAVLEVADTGVGIAEEDAAQIFERFFRTSSAVERAVPGAGLGLSIVKTIVELHQGRIDLDSSPGAGTTVRVRLPVESPRVAHTPAL